MQKHLIDKNNCCGCEACANICSRNAISMQYDDEGFIYPNIQESLCVDCGACDKVCPGLRTQEKHNNYIKAFAGYSNNGSIIDNCASGGFATTISKIILKEKGAVFGVRYTPDLVHTEYVCVTDEKDLSQLMSSKYIQSRKNDIFKEIQVQLRDKKVLFIGCPCDVAALKFFLKKDYENLYTCELICMGITSYKVAEDYKIYTEKRNKSALVDINVRSKKNGWFVPHLEERFENGRTKISAFFGSYYGYAFQVFNRPSCFRCKFRDKAGVGDFRIGDFWGIQKSDEFWNPRGVSCIFLRTTHGEELLRKCEEFNFQLFETTYEKASNNNNKVNKSEKLYKLRQEFAETYKKKGLVSACKKTETFSVKLKRVLPKRLRFLAKKIYHKIRDKK